MGFFDLFSSKKGKRKFTLKEVSNSVSQINDSKVTNLSEIIVFRSSEDEMNARDMQNYTQWMEDCLGRYWPPETSIRARYHNAAKCADKKYRNGKVESILTDNNYPQATVENTDSFFAEHIVYVFHDSLDVDSWMYAFFKKKKKNDNFSQVEPNASKEPNDQEKLLNKFMAEIKTKIGNKEELNELMLDASCESNVDIVRVLVENGADINASNDDGRTALMCAAEFDKEANVFKFLIDQGANINRSMSGGILKGYTALRFSIGKERNSVKKIKLLLDAGVDKNAIISDGLTALQDCQQFKEASEEIKKLLF